MIEELAQLLQSYNKSERIADEEYVKRICSLVVHYKNMEKYLKNVVVVDNSSFKPDEEIKHTTFYLMSRIILVNLDDDHSIEAEASMSEKDYLDWYNAGILDTALHELQHVDQERFRTIRPETLKAQLIELNDIDVKKPNKKFYTRLIKKPAIKKLHEYYDVNHDLAPVERMAELESIEESDRVIKACKDTSYGLQEFVRCQDCCKEEVLLKGYRLDGDITNSPSLEFLERMPYSKNGKIISNNPMFTDMSIPFEDRMLYGLHLTKNEYSKMKKLTR